MIKVRAARKEDAQAASRVLRDSIRELCAADHGGDPERIEQWCANKTPDILATWLNEPGLHVFVSEHGGEIRGEIGGEIGGEIACVGALVESGMVLLNYVDPRFRGEGHCTAMLSHMEAVLVDFDVEEATLESTATALEFYRRAGWQDAGEPFVRFGMAGYPMRKPLEASSKRIPGQ
jgi:GNAT superfamily N-acetyltransferase